MSDWQSELVYVLKLSLCVLCAALAILVFGG